MRVRRRQTDCLSIAGWLRTAHDLAEPTPPHHTRGRAVSRLVLRTRSTVTVAIGASWANDSGREFAHCPLLYNRSAAGSFKILKIFFGLQAEHTPCFSAVVCFVG